MNITDLIMDVSRQSKSSSTVYIDKTAYSIASSGLIGSLQRQYNCRIYPKVIVVDDPVVRTLRKPVKRDYTIDEILDKLGES